jgi:hypothetical protein
MVGLRRAREAVETGARAVNGAMIVAAVALMVALLAVVLVLGGRR